MKKSIKTLNDALTYQLQGLFYAERKIAEAFKACGSNITSTEVKSVVQKYVENTDNVTLKLERVFNYLMLEPVLRKNEIINKMIDETQYLLTYTSSSHLKDILMIGCVKNLNAYKTASLQTSYLIATALELDTATDLIQQVLEWELATGKQIATLSIHEFNKLNSLPKTT